MGRCEWMARGLDAFGFAQLNSAASYHALLTACYFGTELESKRLGLGSVREVKRSRTKLWMELPGLARLRGVDILGWDRAMHKVLVKRGLHVPDEEMRSGRRAAGLPADVLSAMARTRVRQCVRTLALRETHPDALLALSMIQKKGGDLWNQVKGEVEAEQDVPEGNAEDSGGDVEMAAAAT
jgi:hypothetical protein